MTNKEARKVLQEVWRNERTDYESVEVKEAMDRAIKALQERPQGEWIHYLGCGVGKAICSECGQLGETKEYCGNCGARMESDKE